MGNFKLQPSLGRCARSAIGSFGIRRDGVLGSRTPIRHLRDGDVTSAAVEALTVVAATHETMTSTRSDTAFSTGQANSVSCWPKLTSRETAVLKAVATGDSNREIGARLGIGEQTVKNHVSVLIQKFHVRNRVQLAVLVALEMPELLHKVR
jgi:DNA-binding NarL/FixJ family response regulator